MNCLCRLFDDSTLWLIIIAIILVAFFCNNSSGCGYGCDYSNRSSGNGCGCGCN